VVTDEMDIGSKRVFIAGAKGMVGRALVRALERINDVTILAPCRSDLDFADQAAVRHWFDASRPDVVIVAAAKVGGILANNELRADFLYDNLMIEANVINAAFTSAVEKLVFLGSSCIYPRDASQPIKETDLLTGPLEPTNEPYAIAKIAGIKLCESYYRQHGCNFISAMPTNLYGPYDNFDLRNSHVVPALIRKFHEAKMSGHDAVEVWGSGSPRREFLHVDDAAEAILFLTENVEADQLYSGGVSHVNIGSGVDVTIRQLAEMIAEITGFDGSIEYDPTKPDGTPRKLLDVSLINSLGWSSSIDLGAGLMDAYDWFLSSPEAQRGLK
jgi:GDP-L-fucose synthase